MFIKRDFNPEEFAPRRALTPLFEITDILLNERGNTCYKSDGILCLDSTIFHYVYLTAVVILYVKTSRGKQMKNCLI